LNGHLLGETPEFVFDTNTNMWLLAAGLYLAGTQWLEREVGREDAGYEWQSSSRGMETLRQMSDNDPMLTELDVESKRIDDAGASTLAEALKVNKSLMKLYICHNSIGSAGAAAIAEALTVNKSLTTLNVGYNSAASIGAAGRAALLASARPGCTVNV